MSGVPMALALLAAIAFLFCTVGWWRFFQKPQDTSRIRELSLMMVFGCGVLTIMLAALATP